jgi:hypothetical protein
MPTYTVAIWPDDGPESFLTRSGSLSFDPADAAPFACPVTAESAAEKVLQRGWSYMIEGD